MRKLINETATVMLLVLAMYLIGSSSPITTQNTVPDYAQKSFEKQRENKIQGKKSLSEYKGSEKTENKNNSKNNSLNSKKLSYIKFKNLQYNGYVPSTELILDNKTIDINTADMESLCSIKGIGKSTAESIIKFREKNGYFTTVDELILIKGIGEKKLEKIKKLMTKTK